MDEFASYPSKLCKRRRSPTGEGPHPEQSNGCLAQNSAKAADSSRGDTDLEVGMKPLSGLKEPKIRMKEKALTAAARESGSGEALMTSEEADHEQETDNNEKALEESNGGTPCTVFLQWGQRRKLRFPRRQALEEGDSEGKRRRSGELSGVDSGCEPQLNGEAPVSSWHSGRVHSSKWAREGANVIAAQPPLADPDSRDFHGGKIKVESTSQEQTVRMGDARLCISEEGPHAHHIASHRRRQHSGHDLVRSDEVEDLHTSLQDCHTRQDLRNFLIPEFAELPKFLLSLSRSEKEDDFFKIKGSRLPQRPRKRARIIEKGLQRLLPGAWLCNVTRERYEVRERRATKKRPRGLKAMNGIDSDSE